MRKTLSLAKKISLTLCMVCAIGVVPWMGAQWGETIADIWAND